MEFQLRTDVDQVLSSLFGAVSSDLKLNENGMVALGFKDDLEITLEVPAAGKLLFAHAVIARLPLTEAAMRRALERNMFRTGPDGSWIALDAESQALTLCSTMTIGGRLDAEALSAFLAGLLDALGELGRDFEQGADSAAPLDQGAPQDFVVIRS